MSWTILTEDNIATRLAGAELVAFRSAALKDGQVDPLPEVLAEVIDEVRGRIAACSKNRLGPEGTIPASCRRHAKALATYDLLNRLPLSISKERTDAHDKALDFFDDVANCKVGIEEPDAGTEDDATFPAAKPSVKSRERRFSRSQQDGI